MKSIYSRSKYTLPKKNMLLIFLLFAMAALTACSSGSSTSTASGGSNNSTNLTALTGVFLDSPVEGLHYQTDTISGFTGENGTFMYHDGETVTFSIGTVMLGSAPANHIMTPIDLVPGAFDETHPTVTNMIRLLQSLDWDGDLTNGIMITETMHAEMTGRMIDINQGVNQFEDYDMEALFNSLNILGAFHNEEHMGLRSISEAQEHFRQTLMSDMHPDDSTFGQGRGGHMMGW